MLTTTATDTHLQQLLTWFSNQQEVTQWAGPNISYPLHTQQMRTDLNITDDNTIVLQSVDGEVLAFGQYYLRFERCHLARLVVNPNQRGRGVAKVLIEALCKWGLQSLKVRDCSLFVYEHNQTAIKAYEKCGFVKETILDEDSLDGCIFMIKPLLLEKFNKV